MSVTDVDLICVGAGVAGWTAARRAQEHGLSVLVLERHGSGPGWGNGRISGGFFHVAGLDPRAESAERIYARVREVTAGGECREDVARAFAERVGEALGFLERQGAIFAAVAPIGIAANVLQPVDRATGEWLRRGPDQLLTKMWRAAVADGADFRPGRRVTDLVVEDGAVVGVRAEASGNTEEHRALNVLLADGGFHASAELVAEHISPGYLVRGSRGSNEGDALRMGTAMGAATAAMPWFYGHCQSRDALRDDRLWPFPSPWTVAAHGLVVDGHGGRLGDDDLGDEAAADLIAKSTTPLGCWAVLDQRIWDKWAGVDELGLGSPRLEPEYLDRGGTVLRAESVAGLAALAGIPADRLALTVETSSRGLRAPYLAIPLVAGVTFTMGGLLVDGRARVLHNEGHPIPGLFAAGGAMAGLQGGPGPTRGYCGGWSEAATFGLIAADVIGTPVLSRQGVDGGDT